MSIPTILKARQSVAEGTMAFHFDKPAGFDFKPGQAIDVILPRDGIANDSPDARHTFSIVSAPFENELVVTTRMRDSSFKRTLGTWPIGDPIEIEGPFGSLTLPKSHARPAVLIAGGIGITPFMSMVRHANKNQTQQDLLLIYSNHRPEDTAFLDELQQLAKSNPRFHMVATMTDMDRSSQTWASHTEQVDANLIQEATKGLDTPVFYVSGPPGMVRAMSKILDEAAVDEEDVHSEEFYGY